jgi:CRISPR-associated protein Cas2
MWPIHTGSRRRWSSSKVTPRGGQKSAYECFLTRAEEGTLLHDVALVLDEVEDSFLLIGLDPRSRVYTLGRALAPADPDHFHLG